MDTRVAKAPPDENESIESQLSIEPALPALSLTASAAPFSQPTPGMDVTAPPRPAPPEATPLVTNPKPLPKLEKQAAPVQPAVRKPESNGTTGVGMAIAATVIIVIVLAALAVLAYLKQV